MYMFMKFCGLFCGLYINKLTRKFHELRYIYIYHKDSIKRPLLLKITDYIGQKQRITLQYVQNNLKN